MNSRHHILLVSNRLLFFSLSCWFSPISQTLKLVCCTVSSLDLFSFIFTFAPSVISSLMAGLENQLLPEMPIFLILTSLSPLNSRYPTFHWHLYLDVRGTSHYTSTSKPVTLIFLQGLLVNDNPNYKIAWTKTPGPILTSFS